MTGLEALQSVQYITAGGKRFAVVSMDDWEALIDWLETLEDTQAAQDVLAELKRAKGDRQAAGWKQWDDVKSGLE